MIDCKGKAVDDKNQMSNDDEDEGVDVNETKTYIGLDLVISKYREDDSEGMFEEDENVCDTSDEEDDTRNFEEIIIDDNDFELTVGQLFSGVVEFKRSLNAYAIERHFVYKSKKYTPQKFQATCIVPDCH